MSCPPKLLSEVESLHSRHATTREAIMKEKQGDSMPLDWQPFVDAVHKNRRFLLTTHIRPDPDGLGSVLGLAEALTALGKEVRMVVSSIYPPRYHFMDPERRIQRFQLPGDDYRSCEVAVVLDT